MSDAKLREHVVAFLHGKGAHVDFEKAFYSVPTESRGERPDGAAHSLWEILEHMRIAQWDILEFSRNPEHVSHTSQRVTGRRTAGIQTRGCGTTVYMCSGRSFMPWRNC